MPTPARVLADGRGVLVPPGSPAAFAAALNQLLGDDALRAKMGRRAYDYSRQMAWSKVGAEYNALFRRVGEAASGVAAPSSLGMAAISA